MISALLSRFWGYLVAAGALLAAIWAYGRSQKAEGRKETYIETLTDSAKRKEAGREAVEDLRGNDRDDDIEQLRRNSDSW
ncbi:hypothetical protein PhaeoP66_04655 (plasmid) [Phaeobacter inhibens]|uniref:Uncharacterized protein n=1 Tax=Phaeobacter inhibens TaxID=221822 RepID=A0ABM6RLI1_9RHOB|nr:hypothetical protein [Phaeobacter inhibens]AUQ93876.1 hypothetical protein PhaeoP66_01072 [Phaeobacter inhibens]AUQ97381.1 hypothetical protein PhaeoP66_04655 [Phaeobacter inhibens]